MSRPKILVCGDVEGKFKTLFNRVENVNNKSGPFDFLLCVGNFFGDSSKSWEPYRSGKVPVPITTYVLGPNTPDQVHFYSDISGCELAPNVSYLGKRGVFTGTSKLKLAYVSGVEADSESHESDHTFNRSDVTSVRDVCLRNPNYKGVDVLMSSVWPKDIVYNNSVRSDSLQDSWWLSWLAAQIKPRYHFCGINDVYYERNPYSNPSGSDDTPVHVTRFIALAKVGNAEKKKWLYAVNLDPIDTMKLNDLHQQTTDQTPCPYTGKMLMFDVDKKEDGPSQFFYDMNASYEDDNKKKRRNKDEQGPERKRPVFDQEKCWFCLSSPNVEKHLVISIGNEVYLALAKGALVSQHVLILPITHHQSCSDVPDTVTKEIRKFKSALRKFFGSKGCVPVFFERNYKTSHLQIQVVPVPVNLAEQLKSEFQDQAEAENIPLDELPVHAELSQIAPPGTPYFFVELPTGERLFHRIRKRFPLQFGREVLASNSVLEMEERADWKDCKMSREEEVKTVNDFRTAFKPFDFTI